MEYLLILLLPYIISLLAQFVYKIKIYKSTKQMVFVVLTIFIIAVVCDSWLVSKGIIFFNSDKLTGIVFGLLPLEEYVFYLAVPYIVLVLYKLSERHL